MFIRRNKIVNSVDTNKKNQNKGDNMDLDSVKKALISILNLNPKGILADKINQQFKSHVGSNIPWDSYCYPSLLTFLEEELKGNIRIDNENGWNIMLYPIGTGNSAHILKFKENEESRGGRAR